jgi:RNA recognition motif-containing protein
MSVLNDFHRSDLSPLVDQGRHHGHQFRARGMNSEWSRRENNGKILANGRSSSSSSTSGEEMNMIQLSTLGQNRLPAPSIHYHDLNDRKQLELMERTGYEIVQRNGQRIYGGPPPNWQGPPPSKGTEIFVGKIPREMFEWELVPIFEMCGFIYELRLMMDFSGSNRGYLFVRYSKREEASRALKELNNFEIRPGKFIGVIPSVDNRKLWISGLPKNRSADEIRDEMSKLTDGVTAVSIYYSYTDKTKTRGYAFVEYLTHRHAALARRKLVPGRNFLFDQEIERVDWAEPEHEVDPDIMARVKVLFIRNLTMDTTQDEILATFEAVSDGQVDRVKKAKDYAFVHFTTREAAEKAYEATKNKLVLDDCRVEVTWSKPIDRQAHNERKQFAKALTSGTGNHGGLMDHHGSIPLPVTANSMYPPQPLPTATMAVQMNRNFSIGNQSMMLQAQRLNDAPEISGYSTPGNQDNSCPPIDSETGKLPTYNGIVQNDQDYAKMMLKNNQHFISDFAALSLGAAYNGVIPPPGAPISPPPNGAADHAFFGAGSGNMRMMAPPSMPPVQHPLYYYGRF